MKPLTKILLAIATIWPFFYMILFFVFMFGSVFFRGSPEDFPLTFMVIIPMHLFTMFLIMALTVFYMVNVFRNDRVDKDKKVLWAVVLFLGSMIAMPIYWYLYIWREQVSVGPSDRKALNQADNLSWANEARVKEPEKEYVPPREPPNWRD